jgi:FKBP-type peptidyl-prolyl cis-trans isomerase (trigger factor)
MILYPDELGCYAAHFEDVAHLIEGIELPDWGALEVVRSAWEGPEDADVDAIIETMRFRDSTVETRPKGSKVERGDLVTVDVMSWVDGKDMPGGKLEDFRFPAGQYPEFTAGVMGLHVGESRTLLLGKLTDYPDAWVSKSHTHMRFTVKKIERRRLPELGGRYFKRLGISGLPQLRAAAAEQLVVETKAALRRQSTRLLLEQIIRHCPVDIPQDEVETAMEDATAGETPDQQIKRMLKASHRVQLGVLFAKQAHEANLFATDEQVTAYLDWVASARGATKAQRKAMEAKRNEVSKLVTERNVIDYILGRVKVTEVKMDLKKLRRASRPEVELAVAIPGADRQRAVA